MCKFCKCKDKGNQTILNDAIEVMPTNKALNIIYIELIFEGITSNSALAKVHDFSSKTSQIIIDISV